MPDFLFYFFKPEIIILSDINKLLMCDQYDQCAMYIKRCNQRKLKRELRYNLWDSKRKGNTERYRMTVYIYEMVFGKLKRDAKMHGGGEISLEHAYSIKSLQESYAKLQ